LIPIAGIGCWLFKEFNNYLIAYSWSFRLKNSYFQGLEPGFLALMRLIVASLDKVPFSGTLPMFPFAAALRMVE